MAATCWPPESLISIHAPREGSDCCRRRRSKLAFHFNPRSPRGERLHQIQVFTQGFGFQSTLPARGATSHCSSGQPSSTDFNPRSPRGERLRRSCCLPWLQGHFNPRSPRGERRVQMRSHMRRWHISIHAPREGSDHPRSHGFCPEQDFNPRSPRGERRLAES